MANPQEQEKRTEAITSLERMQKFNTASLPRELELGTLVNFAGAVEPAERLIALYRRISVACLEDLPLNQLTTLTTQANGDFIILNQILKFEAGSSVGTRDSLITQLVNAYDSTFNILHAQISFSASKSTDFQGLERQARATIQSVEDLGTKLTDALAQKGQEAEEVLDLVRKAAAEQGVSQQATYFHSDAVEHEGEAKVWGKRILISAGVLGLYAVITIFLHKIPWIKPENAYDTVQLAISKVLIFGVLSYMVYLATKNYLAHKHNAVINKHRQNALMTYKALVDAAKDAPNKEVILMHASACIFSPQSTGYSGGQSPEGPVAKSIVELMTKSIAGDK